MPVVATVDQARVLAEYRVLVEKLAAGKFDRQEIGRPSSSSGPGWGAAVIPDSPLEAKADRLAAAGQI